MDTLHNMRVFARVVDAGGFSAAARQLDVSTARVSRAVADLEGRLGTRLLNRTTRRNTLTDAGERYWRRCEQILAYVAQMEAEVNGAHARPSGKLRLHCMTGVGPRHVVPFLSRYRQRFPDVDVDLTFSQRRPNLIDEGFDVSIVLGASLPESGLVSKRLGATFSIVCASRRYIDQHGVPLVPQDLARHACLGLVSPHRPCDEWALTGPDGEEHAVPVLPVFRANDADALAVGVRDGMGVGLLPRHAAMSGLRNGDFVRVMPHHHAHDLNLYAVHSSRQSMDPKVRTWIDFLSQEVPPMLESNEQALARFADLSPN
ncbi:LysR family transcriptional regulator [Burkholderia sp. PU8-34]